MSEQRSETWGQPTPEEKAKYGAQPKKVVTPEQRTEAMSQLKETWRLKSSDLVGIALLVVGVIVVAIWLVN